MDFEASGWIRAHNITLFTSELILLFYHNKYKQTCSIGSHTHPCHKMWSYASDHEQFLSFFILFSSFWYKFTIVFHFHSMLFQKSTGYNSWSCFWALRLINGLYLVFTLVKTYLDCWPTQIHYLLERSGKQLWRDSSSFFHHSCSLWSVGPFVAP